MKIDIIRDRKKIWKYVRLIKDCVNNYIFIVIILRKYVIYESMLSEK